MADKKKDDPTREIRTRAVDAALLDKRIAGNAQNQSVDMNAWIFERLEFPPNASILELCAGTGAQSVKFLEKLNKEGSLTSTDKSEEALKTLASKVTGVARRRLVTVPADMDTLDATLRGSDFTSPDFDLIFCAYGLYYSRDAKKLLVSLKPWLRKPGRMAIVGPFGANNAALFGLLQKAGVILPEYVTWTSRDFMEQLVVPWGKENFEECKVETLSNQVTWKDADSLMNYWRNSTFFDASKEEAVQKLLHEHFATQQTFVDHKWVMLAQMKGMR